MSLTFSEPFAFINSFLDSCASRDAAIPFLLRKAACAKAVAPPALAPVALKVSKVLAKAMSASSA